MSSDRGEMDDFGFDSSERTMGPVSRDEKM